MKFLKEIVHLVDNGLVTPSKKMIQISEKWIMGKDVVVLMIMT